MPGDASEVLAQPEKMQYETYDYTPEERQFVSDWWQEFLLLYQAKTQPVDMLGGRTLQAFWDDSVRDYAVITETVPEERTSSRP